MHIEKAGTLGYFQDVGFVALNKDILHKQHVADCTGCDSQKQIAHCGLQDDGEGDGDGFRQTVVAAEDLRILERVDHEHTHNRGGQHFTQKDNERRSFFIRREEHKRQKARYHRPGDDSSDCNNFLSKGHNFMPPL